MSFDVPPWAYARFMGRYAEPLADVFTAFSGVGKGDKVLDVGCGPGALTAHLLSVGAEVVAHHPELFAPDAVQKLRLEQILARLAADRYPGVETDKALSRMGREQLWDDISEEPLEYAGFVATKVGRIWSHGPRDVMRQPGWELLHWALVAFGLIGLAMLALRRRWEALLLATIFIAITAISALLVASPRRVLVMMPLVAALAGVGVVAAADLMQRRIRL